MANSPVSSETKLVGFGIFVCPDCYPLWRTTERKWKAVLVSITSMTWDYELSWHLEPVPFLFSSPSISTQIITPAGIVSQIIWTSFFLCKLPFSLWSPSRLFLELGQLQEESKMEWVNRAGRKHPGPVRPAHPQHQSPRGGEMIGSECLGKHRLLDR